MPINKALPTHLSQTGDTYIVFPSATADALKSTEAIAILAYLLDRPPNWVVRRKTIMDRFDLGRHRYDKGMQELRSRGLVWTTYTRGDTGLITATIINVRGTIPAQHTTESRTTSNTDDNRKSDHPKDGSPDLLNSTDYLNMTDSLIGTPKRKPAKAKKPVKRKHLIPEGWQPSLAIVQRLIKDGIQLENSEHTIAAFTAWAELEKREYKDWDLTFFNHCLRTQRYEGITNGKQAGRKETGAEAQARGLQRAIDAAADPSWADGDAF